MTAVGGREGGERRSNPCQSVESVWRRAEQFNSMTTVTVFLGWAFLCPLSVLLFGWGDNRRMG